MMQNLAHSAGKRSGTEDVKTRIVISTGIRKQKMTAKTNEERLA